MTCEIAFDYTTFILKKDLTDLGSIPNRDWIILFQSCPTSYQAHTYSYPTGTKWVQRKEYGTFTPPFRTEVLNMWSFTSMLATCFERIVHAKCIFKLVA
jgi:hypothetical protein